MNEEYKPPVDFVPRVMARVHAYELSKTSFLERIGNHPLIRYILVLGGTLFGVLRAASAF